MNALPRLSFLLLPWLVALFGVLPSTPLAQGIYSCVDEKGRKITSDRPIAECMDRAQKEMNPSGTVRRVVAPPPTAKDRAAEQEKEKQDAEAKLQLAEDKRRDRELAKRYPSRASHDKERATALAQVNESSDASAKRVQDLAEQRKGIVAELDFYKSTPGKAPPNLKRRLDETDANIVNLKRLVAEQDAEKKRINQRFDEEAAKLRPQWGVAAAPEPATAAKKP